MKKLLLISLFMNLFYQSLWANPKLPELLNQAPSQSFEMLGPVSATMKSIEESKIELLHQAQKLEADAVILKDCKAGGIEREGLSWSKARASCEGIAIRYKNTKPAKISP